MPSYSIKHKCFLIFLFFAACESKIPNIEKRKSDTLNVEYSDYTDTRLNGVESQTLVKTISGDTTTFTYFDSLLSKKSRTYSIVKSKNGSYELLKYAHLGFVNQFIGPDSILLLKFEELNPPMDGDGAVILNPELGEIATYSYTWGNCTIMTKRNGVKIPEELIEILFSDSLISPHYYYLKDIQNVK